MMGNKEPENEFIGTGNFLIHSFGKHCSSSKQKADRIYVLEEDKQNTQINTGSWC